MARNSGASPAPTALRCGLLPVAGAYAAEAGGVDELLEGRAPLGRRQRRDAVHHAALELEAAAGEQVAVDDAEDDVVLRQAVLVGELPGRLGLAQFLVGDAGERDALHLLEERGRRLPGVLRSADG